MILKIIGAILALAMGIYWGLGAPGLAGPKDRVLPSGTRRRVRRHFTPLDLLRPRERPSERRRGLLR